jgi:NADH:quinone reductase (non-electrogenic)
MNKSKVIIIGAGFGGLAAAKTLKNADVEILMIDKTNHHLFQPLLYQVATAALSPGDIAAPVRGILRAQKNVSIIMGEVVSIDKKNQKVKMHNSDEFHFDFLIVATGARHSYFGNDEWEKYAPGLKTISDALKIRERILLSFEKAERSNDPNEIEKQLTFVIVGGGPTGVEMAGAIAEISKKTMLKDFRKIDPSKTKIILIEGTDKLLNSFDQPLNSYTKRMLENMGVIVKVGKFVKQISSDGVQVDNEFFKTSNVIWAAGNTASPLLKKLNTELDKAGRLIVEKDCSIKEYPNIFVIGDAANYIDEKGKPLPGVAPVAEQQGKFVAKLIAQIKAGANRKVFKYFDKGNLATIGRAKAVLQISNFKLSGFSAWLIWGFVHIAFLINFRKRYKVMTEWIWSYLTFKNDIRLITHKTDL